MGTDQFLLLLAISGESGSCLGIVLCHPSNKALHKTRAELCRLVVKAVLVHCCKSIVSSNSVALRERAGKPALSYTWKRSGIFRADFIDGSMHGAGFRFPIKFYDCALHFWLSVSYKSQRAVEEHFFLGIAPEKIGADRRLL